ncbi:MAG: hypothetical protein ACN6NW_00790 [Acinetobacter amyesii]
MKKVAKSTEAIQCDENVMKNEIRSDLTLGLGLFLREMPDDL